MTDGLRALGQECISLWKVSLTIVDENLLIQLHHHMRILIAVNLMQ